MKNWFKCFECGEFFEDPGENLPETRCPECGSFDTADVETCNICGGPIKDTVEDICPDCQNRIIDALQQEVEDALGEDIDYKDALDAAWDYLADVIRNR